MLSEFELWLKIIKISTKLWIGAKKEVHIYCVQGKHVVWINQLDYNLIIKTIRSTSEQFKRFLNARMFWFRKNSNYVYTEGKKI